MHLLTIPFLENTDDDSQRLEKSVPVSLNHAIWLPAEHVSAQVFMCWSTAGLFLRFSVQETEVRAMETEDNHPVWEDSCVEFFVAPEGENAYYNFEFNCIGTCLLGYGSSRTNRTFADQSITRRITRSASLGYRPFVNRPFSGSWELQVIIPPAAFFMHSLSIFNPCTLRANFYKCGDKLTHPHFLAWKKIEWPEPDFHRPEFFGSLQLTV